MSIGVAFSIKADLGTSPISSVPYVVSLIGSLTVGQATIIMHCVFITLQILILRKKYKLIQLMQLPVAFIFGYMTDFSIWMLSGLSYSSYAVQWVYCLIGIVLVATGVSCEVVANVVMLAGEGLVSAICQVAPIKFANMKVIFDVSLVVTAVLIGFVSTHSLVGVREGTIAAAILVGQVSKLTILPVRAIEKRVCESSYQTISQ